jgi:hypothetical protein
LQAKAQHEAPAQRDIGHRGGLAGVQGRRLLAQHVLAGRERRRDHRVVQIGRQRDHHRIQVGLLEQLGGGREAQRTGAARQLTPALGIEIRDRRDVPSAAGQKALGVPLAGPAAAHDANPKLMVRHGRRPAVLRGRAKRAACA